MSGNYTLIRSRRRTLALEMKPDGSLTVRAPLLTPEKTIEAFVAAHADWIARHRAALPPPAPEPTPEETAALRRKAAEILPGRVAFFAAKMGLTPASVRITSARRRFGSCSSRGGLCFSCYLMRYPPEAVDYVVVHELAHLRHPDHSPAFHALVEKFLPDAKERRRMLKGPGAQGAANREQGTGNR